MMSTRAGCAAAHRLVRLLRTSHSSSQRSFKCPPPALLRRTFSSLLAPPQGDGFIDYNEMKAILTRGQASFGKSDLTQGALRDVDGRSDASFSEKEADARWKTWLHAFDANGDGKLSIEELAEAMSYSGMVYELYQLVAYKKVSLGWNAQLTKLLDELKTVNDGKFLAAVLSISDFNAGQDASLKGRTPLGVLFEVNPYDYSKEVPTLLSGAIFFGLKGSSGLWKSLVDKKYAADVDRVPVWLRPHGKRGYTLLHMAVALHSERLVKDVLALGYSMGGPETVVGMIQKKRGSQDEPEEARADVRSREVRGDVARQPGREGGLPGRI